MSIKISRINKAFGSDPVLRRVDLQINKGELIALLGPSGSGKTTLLKIVAGLEWADSGDLSVDGTDWLTLSARERRVGFVFQHYALFPHMRVRDNIAFGLTVRPRATRPSNAQIASRVADLLAFLQIEELADRYPAQLSGGQRQRVAIGRALAIEPTVMLLDEPFGALDAAIRRDLRRWLRGVHDATGSTTIFVTHDQEEAFELADRVVIMAAGRIEQIGRPDDIHDHPATPGVASFLGATNRLSAILRQGRTFSQDLDLTAVPAHALPDGPGWLFFRPADVGLTASPSGPWRVTSRASTGARLLVSLRHPVLGTIEADVPRRQAPEGLNPGDSVLPQVVSGSVFPDPGSHFERNELRPLATSILNQETIR